MKLGKLYEKIARMKVVAELFGETFECHKEFRARLGILGRLIAEEHGLCQVSEARHLPPDTPIGKKAEGYFKELEEWFEAKSAPVEEKAG
jgi:hypothetical protein